MPVYKFSEVKDKIQTKTGKVHKTHPVLKDKLSVDDNETLSAKSLDKDIQKDNVETKKPESTEKMHEVYSSMSDNLSLDNNEAPSPSVDQSTSEIEAIDVDRISPSYEVIDGTTFYFDSKPSIEQKSATETMHSTALPNEQASPPYINIKTDSNNNGDRLLLINEREIQHDTNINKPEGIKLSVDIPEKTNTKTLLENSEAIINPTVDTVGKDDVSLHDASSKSKDELFKDLESEAKSVDSSAEESTEYTKKESTENTENEGIFASFARKFNILSETLETAMTESTTSQNDNDMSTLEVTTDSKTVIEENIPASETLLSVDTSVASKDEEIQQEPTQSIIENIQSMEISNEEIKLEKETIAVRSENAASHDVPLISNFVREDAVHKPAQDLSIASSILVNNTASEEADISSHTEDIKIQETRNEKKVIENIETEGIGASFVEESTISPDVQKTTTIKSITTQSYEHTSPVNAKEFLENAKEDVHTKSIAQVEEVAAVNEIPETNNLPSVEDTLENIAKEVLPDSSIVGDKTVISDDSSNRNTADIQLGVKSIVHSNVNKNDNLVNDASSGNVPIESNEFSNDVKSSIVSSEQSANSSQENMISEENWAFDKHRNLAGIKDFEHKNSGY